MTSKRYQVFVSSTYDDLIEERVEIMQALLEFDCLLEWNFSSNKRRVMELD
jgi:hypothetical protein